MSSTPLQVGTTTPTETSAETNRNLALVTPAPGEDAPSSRPFATQSRLRTWVRDYWWSGIVVGLVVFDGLVLLIGFYDCVRFTFQGLSLADAWDFAWEAGSESGFVALGITVFTVFLVALPALAALLLAWFQHRQKRKDIETSSHTPHPQNSHTPALGDSEKNSTAKRIGTGHGRPHFFQRGGKVVFLLHLILAGSIAIFTVVAQSMETLSGWGKGEAYAYSFSSAWLLIVLYLKLAYPGYFLPVFRKFIVRAAGGERPSLREVGREVMTEDGLRGEH